MQTDTVLPPFVPASMMGSQDHCSRQSVVATQSTRQIQPVSSSAHDEPDGQLFELPHERVQRLPGNASPAWQSPSSHSLLLIHGPPTNVLSLPAMPAGRPSSPQAESRNEPSTMTEGTKNDFMAGRR